MTGSKLEDTVNNIVKTGTLIGMGVGGAVSAAAAYYYLVDMREMPDPAALVACFGAAGAVGGMFLGMIAAARYVAVRYGRNSHHSSEQ